MNTCKICNGIYKRLLGHIVKKHKNLNVDLEIYLLLYYNFSICGEYINGKSAKQISNEINNLTNGAINPNKKDILSLLKDKKVAIRQTSEAIKKWSEKRGGPWNKGLTKEEHPSIKNYSISRIGTNNPYHKLSEEKKKKIRYWEYLSDEELKKIRTASGDKLKLKYRNGEIVHKSVTDPLWAEQSSFKRREGYKKWVENDNSLFHGAESKLEKQIADVLERNNIKYKKQFKLKGENKFYFYDYLLTEYNILIEYNGSYWHADPRLYEENYFNTSKDMYAKQIWEKDELKKQLAVNSGYDIVILWEEDYKKLTNEEFINKVYDSIQNKINQKS